jgi:hypothetical protein
MAYGGGNSLESDDLVYVSSWCAFVILGTLTFKTTTTLMTMTSQERTHRNCLSCPPWLRNVDSCRWLSMVVDTYVTLDKTIHNHRQTIDKYRQPSTNLRQPSTTIDKVSTTIDNYRHARHAYVTQLSTPSTSIDNPRHLLT